MSVYVGTRDVVTVAGEEATKYLQGQISQDVLGLAVGESAWSLILQPQGKVDAWFRITKTADDAYALDVDAGHGETLLARLKRFKLRTKADLELVTWDWHAWRAAAPDIVAPDGAIVAPPPGGQSGVDVIGPHLDAPEGDELSANDLDRLRIEAFVPAMGAELTEDTIPAEAGIVDASVSFTKGCYTGQELVARVDSRGNNTPRRLRLVTGAGLPSASSALMLDGADVGVLTSVASSGDGFVALAYVKRSASEATELELDGATVTVAAPPAEGNS